MPIRPASASTWFSTMRGPVSRSDHSDGVMGVTTIAAPDGLEPVAVAARLREQLAERDEIIVALQHVICDLRHEIDNLSVERAYAAFAHLPQGRASHR
jgi:hypothetical protein